MYPQNIKWARVGNIGLLQTYKKELQMQSKSMTCVMECSYLVGFGWQTWTPDCYHCTRTGTLQDRYCGIKWNKTIRRDGAWRSWCWIHVFLHGATCRLAQAGGDWLCHQDCTHISTRAETARFITAANDNEIAAEAWKKCHTDKRLCSDNV